MSLATSDNSLPADAPEAPDEWKRILEAVLLSAREPLSLAELRSLQDWVVRKHLLGVPGVIDVSSFGGLLKQYEVSVDARRLAGAGFSLMDVFNALENNNANTGGSYIEKGPNIYFIRGEGVISSLKDVENIVISARGGSPVRVPLLSPPRTV